MIRRLATQGTRLGPYGLSLVVWLLILQAGCQKQVARRPPLPPPDLRQQAERYFDQGDLGSAAAAYQAYLSGHPSGVGTDRVLFRLALTYLFPESPVHDPARARVTLKRLVEEWSNSPYAAQARLMVELEDQLQRARNGLRERESRIRKLTEELEQLKEIDMRR